MNDLKAPNAEQCEALKAWATPKQHEYLDALAKYGSFSKASKKIGVDRRGFARTISAVQVRAVLHGHSPEHGLTQVVPDPLILRGTSTLYDADGNQKLQWVKTKLDDARVEAAMRAAIEALAEDMPRARPVPLPALSALSEHLCNLYTFTDCHIGMKSWGVETGADWDLAIAEDMLTRAFDYLVDASPAASVALVSQLGDFLHFDGLIAETPTSHHPLDADSRYGKVVKVAVRILRYIVHRALERHERVVVLVAEGNHDPSAAPWLRHLFALLYENEPRVAVIESELPYYAHQHGKTMLAFHHGHIRKPDDLPLIFAGYYPEMWGASRHRYAHCGHLHHIYEKEHLGMTVTQHSTLAAKDSYTARGGWGSDRHISAITYHSEFGKAGSTVITPEMVMQ